MNYDCPANELYSTPRAGHEGTIPQCCSRPSNVIRRAETPLHHAQREASGRSLRVAQNGLRRCCSCGFGRSQGLAAINRLARRIHQTRGHENQ